MDTLTYSAVNLYIQAILDMSDQQFPDLSAIANFLSIAIMLIAARFSESVLLLDNLIQSQ